MILKFLEVVSAVAILVFVGNYICPNKPIVTYSYSIGRGYWAELRTIDGSHWNMHRGPYPFWWMAYNAFPIQRWTFKNPYRP